MDQAVLAASIHSRAVLKGFASIRQIFLVIFLHQVESFNHSIFNRIGLFNMPTYMSF